MVEPPVNTMLLYKSFLISTSHFIIDWNVDSWRPGYSFPSFDGVNKTSGHLNS